MRKGTPLNEVMAKLGEKKPKPVPKVKRAADYEEAKRAVKR
jgi:hypothetical protein